MEILFFGALKETIKCSKLAINEDQPKTVLELRSKMNKDYGENNFQKNVLCAVNQEFAKDSTEIKDSDEIAFFPPVTGG